MINYEDLCHNGSNYPATLIGALHEIQPATKLVVHGIVVI